MQSTMMPRRLSLNDLLERAGQLFAGNEVVSRRPDKSLVRHRYGEIYRRTRAFRENSHRLLAAFLEDTITFGQEITRARELLPNVDLSPKAESLGLQLVQELQIPSHRAEITVFEAARALAAADGRQTATPDDVAAVAPMALRQRRSEFIRKYCEMAQGEEQDITTVWRNLMGAGG